MGYLKLVVFGQDSLQLALEPTERQENEAHNNILRQKSSRPVGFCVTNMISLLIYKQLSYNILLKYTVESPKSEEV